MRRVLEFCRHLSSEGVKSFGEPRGNAREREIHRRNRARAERSAE